MSLESKVNIVGSAKIKKSIYYSDYDSFEKVQGKNENIIYNHFRSVFEIIRDSENTIISDFKMGEFKGEPLRWTYEDIKQKMNNGVTFDQALKMKSMIKIDVVTLLNGRFIEITEVYNIFINGKSNADYDINTVRHELMHDMKELISEGMYMKALKRQYSLYNIEGKTKMKERLLQYFNSPIGLLNMLLSVPKRTMPASCEMRNDINLHS